MQISPSGTIHNQQVYSDANEFRNEDYVSANQGAFMRGVSAASGAGEYPHAQVHNPGASGVVVLVDRIIVGVNGSNYVRFAWHDAPLTSDQGNFYSVDRAGAAGLTDMRIQNTATELGTVIFLVILVADHPLTIKFKYPLVLREGEGFLVNNRSLNTVVNVNYFIREV